MKRDDKHGRMNEKIPGGEIYVFLSLGYNTRRRNKSV